MHTLLSSYTLPPPGLRNRQQLHGWRNTQRGWDVSAGVQRRGFGLPLSLLALLWCVIACLCCCFCCCAPLRLLGNPGDPTRHQLDHREGHAEGSPLPLGVHVVQTRRGHQPQGTCQNICVFVACVRACVCHKGKHKQQGASYHDDRQVVLAWFRGGVKSARSCSARLDNRRRNPAGRKLRQRTKQYRLVSLSTSPDLPVLLSLVTAGL